MSNLIPNKHPMNPHINIWIQISNPISHYVNFGMCKGEAAVLYIVVAAN
jgi:hypothetical protein